MTHADLSGLEHFAFGDSPQMAEDLLALVLAGAKTGTCWPVVEGLKGSAEGARYVVLDSAGHPRALIESVHLERKRFDEVDADFARSEGEGDLSLETWRRLHEECFTRQGTYAPDMMLWCESFRLMAVLDTPSQDWRALETFTFGDSPEMADRLLGFVLSGAKTATCWAARDGELTHVGKRMVAKDGAGQPRAIIETVSLEKLRFNEVGWTFAHAEGEGDTCLEDWRDGHRAYFTRNGGFAPDMLLYCERFRLVEIIGEGADR
jgi:uncharacterized protein YhfF